MWQLLMSCLAIVLASFIYHGFRYVITRTLEPQARGYTSLNKRNAFTTEEYLLGIKSSKHTTSISHKYPQISNQMRLLHALLNALNYGLALMLMLVAMTFNPCLFLALVIGYGLGDYYFFIRMQKKNQIDEDYAINEIQ